MKEKEESNRSKADPKLGLAASSLETAQLSLSQAKTDQNVKTDFKAKLRSATPKSNPNYSLKAKPKS